MIRLFLLDKAIKCYGRAPSRGGLRSGYTLQSFFAGADKKRISVSILHAGASIIRCINPLQKFSGITFFTFF